MMNSTKKKKHLNEIESDWGALVEATPSLNIFQGWRVQRPS